MDKFKPEDSNEYKFVEDDLKTNFIVENYDC